MKTDDWTPAPDIIVKEFGLLTATLFGRIWRYCQGDSKICSVSQGNIANELGVTRSVINREIKKLIDAGYIVGAKSKNIGGFDIPSFFFSMKITKKGEMLFSTENKSGKKEIKLPCENGTVMHFQTPNPKFPKCERCGYVGPAIQGHHVLGRRNSNKVINVCNNCHTELHIGDNFDETN